MRILVCCFLLLATIIPCSSQHTTNFSNYLKLFPEITLPTNGAEAIEEIGDTQAQKQIPSNLVKKYINPFQAKPKPLHFPMGRIPWIGNKVILLVRRGSVEWGLIRDYLLVYNRDGKLLQKLIFDDNVYTRNQLFGYLSEDHHIKLKAGYYDYEKQAYIPKTYSFKINQSGKIIAINQDRWGYLEDMTPAGQMIKQAKAYYGSLDKGNYSLISLYFAPKVHQWLTLKNTNGDKIATEANRFLSTKRNVYYTPLFSKAQIKGNTLTLPVKLGWNNYQANIIAKLIFNERYEIVVLEEKAK